MSYRSVITGLAPDWWLRHDSTDLYGDATAGNRDLTTTDGTATTGSGLAATGGTDSALLLADGDTACTTADAAGLVPLATGFTLFVIAKPNDAGEGIELALHRNTVNGDALRLQISVDAAGIYRVLGLVRPSFAEQVSISDYVGTGYPRALLRYDGTTLDLWVHGVRVASIVMAATGFAAWASAHFRLSAGDATWDEEVFWNRDLTDEEVIALFWASGGITMLRDAEVPYLEGNDRYQLIVCTDDGSSDTGVETAPIFRYWAPLPVWGELLAGAEPGDIVPTYAVDEVGAGPLAQLDLALNAFKDGTEAVIEAIEIMLEPRPPTLDTDDGGVTEQDITITGRIYGYGGHEAAAVQTADFTVTYDVATVADTPWVNRRVAYLPIDMPTRVRAYRIHIEFRFAEIKAVRVYGKRFPTGRT